MKHYLNILLLGTMLAFSSQATFEDAKNRHPGTRRYQLDEGNEKRCHRNQEEDRWPSQTQVLSGWRYG